VLGALIIVFREVIEAGLIVGHRHGGDARASPNAARYISPGGVAVGRARRPSGRPALHQHHLQRLPRPSARSCSTQPSSASAVVNARLAQCPGWARQRTRDPRAEMRQARRGGEGPAPRRLMGLAIVVAVAGAARRARRWRCSSTAIFIAFGAGAQAQALIAGGLIGLALGRGVVTAAGPMAACCRFRGRLTSSGVDQRPHRLAGGRALASQAVGFSWEQARYRHGPCRRSFWDSSAYPPRIPASSGRILAHADRL